MNKKFIPEIKRWCSAWQPRVITVTHCQYESWVDLWSNLTAGDNVASSPFRDEDAAEEWARKNYPELPLLIFEDR